MLQKTVLFAFLIISSLLFSQIENEIAPPFNIKTVSFSQSNQNTIPIFKLGDSFKFSFDDLYGDEANYYYTISHCDYDWKPSQLPLNDYLTGLDNQRIIDYENSFNTLQMYSHYRLSFPNRFTKGFKVSGNYVLKILNDSREVIFTRKFILYEDVVSVPMQIKSARNVQVVDQKHNLEFSVVAGDVILQNPIQNIKILLLQNGLFNTAITNIKPMFTIGNNLIYKYDKETQFWAGNEFLFFDTKDVRVAANSIRRIDAKGTYNSYLYTNHARANTEYTYFPDANGNFMVRNINANNNDNDVVADYTWVFFSLSVPSYFGSNDIYVSGWFNNFGLNAESKMDYNKEKGIYEKAIMVKQGFTNYMFTLADKKGKVDFENAIDGNFFQTENNYFAIVYYRSNSDRYDRVIGKGMASSVDIIK